MLYCTRTVYTILCMHCICYTVYALYILYCVCIVYSILHTHCVYYIVYALYMLHCFVSTVCMGSIIHVVRTQYYTCSRSRCEKVWPDFAWSQRPQYRFGHTIYILLYMYVYCTILYVRYMPRIYCYWTKPLETTTQAAVRRRRRVIILMVWQRSTPLYTV